MTTPQASIDFMNQIFGGAWITQGIAVAAELGVADILATGARPVDELASQVGAEPTSLYRLLRALAAMGIFAQDEQARFCLTPPAELLRSDVPGSQRARAIMMGGELHRTWGELLHSVKTGEQGFQKHFGMPFFDYMTRNPQRHAIYDTAMNGVHGPETAAMLAAYDFSRFRSVVDVGGGNGHTLAALLERHPHLQGILYDLPGVADRAGELLAEAGLADRCRNEGGDFFKAVPAGADAYILRHVIHDWEDPEAQIILTRCREAMRPDSVLLMVETVLPPGNTPSFAKWLDLMMLLVGGRERDQEAYRHLIRGAGLILEQIAPTSMDLSILVCGRAT